MYKGEGAGRHSMNKARGAGHQGMYKYEGAGRRGTYKAEGAGRQGMYKAEGAGSHDQVWPETCGKARKMNVRHIMMEGDLNKDEDVGHQGTNKTKGAGRQGMYKAEGTGHQGTYKDEGASRQGMYEARGAGHQGTYKAEGAGRQGTYKDEGAGHHNMNKAEGAGRSGMYKDEGAGQEKEVRRIKGGGKRASWWVKVDVGGEELDLYCDTGSNITIITPAMYKKSMGRVVATKSYLRAWGSDDYLDTKDMFKTTLTTSSGATKRTWVYVVAGARPEPLLGDHNTDLGIISFHPEGRQHQGSDDDDESYEDVMNVSIPAKLRKAGKEGVTERPPLHKVRTKGKEEAARIVNRYKGPVFTDRVGKMKMEAVH